MSEVTKDILAKIRKLIEHEKSAREIGSLQEANAFAGKVAELCDKYRIALSDVPEVERQDDIGEADWDPTEAGQKSLRRQSKWQTVLAFGISRGHFCHLMVFKGMNDLRFVGACADVEVAKAMMTILSRAAQASCKIARKRTQGLSSDQFLIGFAMAIKHRYEAQRQQQQAAHSESTQALVRQTDQLIRQRYADTPAAKPFKSGARDGESLRAGYRAGMETNLNSNLIQAATPAKQLLSENS